MVEFISLEYFAVYNSVNFSLDYHSRKNKPAGARTFGERSVSRFPAKPNVSLCFIHEMVVQPFSISFKQLCQSNEMLYLKRFWKNRILCEDHVFKILSYNYLQYAQHILRDVETEKMSLM